MCGGRVGSPFHLGIYPLTGWPDFQGGSGEKKGIGAVFIFKEALN